MLFRSEIEAIMNETAKPVLKSEGINVEVKIVVNETTRLILKNYKALIARL